MKMRTALLLALIPSGFVATSCAPSAMGDSRAVDVSAIQALDEQWSATAARNDLDGTVAFYADDAVLLPPNALIATDRKSIRESWSACSVPTQQCPGRFPKSKSRNPLNSDIFTEPTRSRSRIRKADRGSLIPLVEIWNKWADGKWKCIVDTYNSDLPAAPTTEGKK